MASRYSSAERSSSSATSSEPRITVSGVRSSWETSAMNCCCSFSAVAVEFRRKFNASAISRAAGPRSADPMRFNGYCAVSSRRCRRTARSDSAAGGSATAGVGGGVVRPREKIPTRRSRLFLPGRGLADPVADAAHGLDDLLPLARVELLAQRVDVHVDDVRRELEGVLPDARLDLGARDDLASAAEEQLEQRALAGGQAGDV